jgi:hypothetical protein
LSSSDVADIGIRLKLKSTCAFSTSIEQEALNGLGFPQKVVNAHYQIVLMIQDPKDGYLSQKMSSLIYVLLKVAINERSYLGRFLLDLI